MEVVIKTEVGNVEEHTRVSSMYSEDSGHPTSAYSDCWCLGGPPWHRSTAGYPQGSVEYPIRSAALPTAALLGGGVSNPPPHQRDSGWTQYCADRSYNILPHPPTWGSAANSASVGLLQPYLVSPGSYLGPYTYFHQREPEVLLPHQSWMSAERNPWTSGFNRELLAHQPSLNGLQNNFWSVPRDNQAYLPPYPWINQENSFYSSLPYYNAGYSRIEPTQCCLVAAGINPNAPAAQSAPSQSASDYYTNLQRVVSPVSSCTEIDVTDGLSLVPNVPISSQGSINGQSLLGVHDDSCEGINANLTGNNLEENLGMYVSESQSLWLVPTTDIDNENTTNTAEETSEVDVQERINASQSSTQTFDGQNFEVPANNSVDTENSNINISEGLNSLSNPAAHLEEEHNFSQISANERNCENSTMENSEPTENTAANENVTLEERDLSDDYYGDTSESGSDFETNRTALPYAELNLLIQITDFYATNHCVRNRQSDDESVPSEFYSDDDEEEAREQLIRQGTPFVQTGEFSSAEAVESSGVAEEQLSRSDSTFAQASASSAVPAVEHSSSGAVMDFNQTQNGNRMYTNNGTDVPEVDDTIAEGIPDEAEEDLPIDAFSEPIDSNKLMAIMEQNTKDIFMNVICTCEPNLRDPECPLMHRSNGTNNRGSTYSQAQADVDRQEAGPSSRYPTTSSQANNVDMQEAGPSTRHSTASPRVDNIDLQEAGPSNRYPTTTSSQVDNIDLQEAGPSSRDPSCHHRSHISTSRYHPYVRNSGTNGTGRSNADLNAPSTSRTADEQREAGNQSDSSSSSPRRSFSTHRPRVHPRLPLFGRRLRKWNNSHPLVEQMIQSYRAAAALLLKTAQDLEQMHKLETLRRYEMYQSQK